VHAHPGHPGSLPCLRTGARREVRWFQIVPNTGRHYKNANHPSEAKPYEWVGSERSNTNESQISEWRGRVEVALSIDETFHGASPSPITTKTWEAFGSKWNRFLGTSVCVRLVFRRAMSTTYLQQCFGFRFRRMKAIWDTYPAILMFLGCSDRSRIRVSTTLGVDCADAPVAANQRWRGLGEGKDSNVSILVSQWRTMASFPIVGGNPKASVKWTGEVHPGDAIAVRYTPGKAFQHIGALYAGCQSQWIA